MSEYTDLIREARGKFKSLDDVVVVWPRLLARLSDALEVSVARTAELETVIEKARQHTAVGRYQSADCEKAHCVLGAVSL